MIRRVLSLGLAFAVQGGALCAPYLHAHVDSHHDDHHSTSVHAHFSSHGPAPSRHDGASVEEAEPEQAIYLQAFVAVETRPFQPPALPRTIFALTPIVDPAPRTFVIVTHGHDPPLVSALDSRPPPSHLSLI